MVECPDVENCRDKLYKRISDNKSEVSNKIDDCAKLHDKKLENKMSYRGVGIAITIAITIFGVIFGIWNDAQSDSQEKVEERVEKIETENKDTREKQVNVITRLDALESQVKVVKGDVKKNQGLLIKIGERLNVDTNIETIVE